MVSRRSPDGRKQMLRRKMLYKSGLKTFTASSWDGVVLFLGRCYTWAQHSQARHTKAKTVYENDYPKNVIGMSQDSLECIVWPAHKHMWNTIIFPGTWYKADRGIQHWYGNIYNHIGLYIKPLHVHNNVCNI